MTTEASVLENQHFSVSPTEDQLKLLNAKELLKDSLQWVEQGCRARDQFAFTLKAQINKFISEA